MTDILAYLCGPLTASNTGTVAEHVARASEAYLRLSAAGVPTHCPHLSALVPGAFEVPYETWMANDFAIIRRCTHLVLLPGWEQSAGSVRERDLALRCGLPVMTVDGLIEHVALPRLPQSAQPCGCDAGAGWRCEAHRDV